MPAPTENRIFSRTYRATATIAPYRVMTQGADSSDFFRTAVQAALVTDAPAGISRGTQSSVSANNEISGGLMGEYPVEVAAAVAIGDRLIVDNIGGIGRVKPVGNQSPPYWEVGIARSVQATIGGLVQVEYRPRFVPRVDAQGAALVAANDLAPGADGNLFEITGATQINRIANTNFANGSRITLQFAAGPTVAHAQASGGANITILLAGAVNFVATAGDTLTLVLGTIGGVQAWREVGRAVI